MVSDQTINGSESGTSFRQALFFKECGFNLHDTMIWQKDSCAFPDATRYQQIFDGFGERTDQAGLWSG